MDIREHQGFAHGLEPGTDRDINCLACQRSTGYGWCDERVSHNGAVDHVLTDRCVGFVSDAEHTAQMLAEAREHDAQVTYSPEAAYVAQHRPY